MIGNWKLGFAGLGLVLMSLAFGSIVGCGDDDAFQATSEPDFTIDGLSGQRFTLDLSLASDRHATQGRAIILRNNGRGDLVINKMEWVGEKPDRLVMEKFRTTNVCQSDNDCSANQVCMVQSSRCWDVGLPDTPMVIPHSQQHQLSFIVKRGQGELNCPQPDADVPAEFRDNYCGQLLIETNAPNSAGIVQDGKARIYFATDGSSGEMSLNPQFIQFSNAKPGVTQSQQFTITNTASQPLRVERADVYEFAEYFSITPQNFPLTIDGHGSSTWTLTFSPPSSLSEDELKFSTKVVFETSSTGASARELLVEVTQDVGSAPQIQVEPDALSFAQADEQVVTISNIGNATLQLTGISVQPREVREYYRFFLGGVDITDDFPSPRPYLTRAEREDGETIPTSMDLTVKFTAPADGASAIGTLEIRHNDTSVGNMSQVTLMGDLEDTAIGEVTPGFIAFFAGAGQSDARYFAIRNRGNVDLVIDGFDFDVPPGSSSSNFTVEGVVGTVPAGGMTHGVVRYEGTSNATNSIGVVLNSNTGGHADDMRLTVISQPAPAAPTLQPSVTPSFTSAAKVGEETTLTVEDSSGEANLDHAVWFVLGRPAASSLFFEHTGSSVSFVPDAAGSYRVSVTLYNDYGLEVQEVFDFDAQD